MVICEVFAIDLEVSDSTYIGTESEENCVVIFKLNEVIEMEKDQIVVKKEIAIFINGKIVEVDHQVDLIKNLDFVRKSLVETLEILDVES